MKANARAYANVYQRRGSVAQHVEVWVHGSVPSGKSNVFRSVTNGAAPLCLTIA